MRAAAERNRAPHASDSADPAAAALKDERRGSLPIRLNQVRAVRVRVMAHKRGGLLAQIEADVVGKTVPLSSILQKCIVL